MTWKAAQAGIITGVLLAVARISGETAPLLFTALGNNQFMSTDITKPMASLPAVIFTISPLSPYEDWHSLAWAGALLVTATVLTLSIIARLLENRNGTDPWTPPSTSAGASRQPAGDKAKVDIKRSVLLLRRHQVAEEHHPAA